MLTPFGSPQNIFLFSRSGVSAGRFLLHMLPLNLFSGVLLVIFILVLYRRDRKETIGLNEEKTGEDWLPERKTQRIGYLVLFALVVWTIVSRTSLWPYVTVLLAVSVFFIDRSLYRRVDYVLLLTFLCFFVFSSSIAANPGISGFLRRSVAGAEYWWGILLSQLISNVPAAIVLWPFTENLSGLLYGVDTAGLCSLIGSLASVINYRIYVREYPGRGGKFIKTFTLVSWAFFAIVVLPGYFLSRWSF